MNTTLLLFLHGLAVGLLGMAIMALFWYAILPHLPLRAWLDRCNQILPYSGCLLGVLYLISFVMGGTLIMIVAFIVVGTVSQAAGIGFPPSDDNRFLSVGIFVGSFIGSVFFRLLESVVRNYRRRTGRDHSHL